MISIDWKKFAQDYQQLITTEFSGLNLTALKTIEDIYQKQVIDSIEPFNQIPSLLNPINESRYIIDLGTGGGFPLLPLAKLFSKKFFVGIDARNKKLIAVKSIADNLGLENVNVIHATFSEIKFDMPRLVFLIKAVGKISDILNSLTLEYSSDFYFYKGANFYQLEVEELNKLKNNYHLVNIHEIHIEGLEKRYLVHLRYEDNVPRGTLSVKKQRMFSSLI